MLETNPCAIDRNIGRAYAYHLAPTRNWVVDADTEKAQACLTKDDCRNAKADRHQQGVKANWAPGGSK